MSNVISLDSFRNKKKVNDEVGLNKRQYQNTPPSTDFDDRLSRIRGSVAKINSLMAELKRLSKEENINREQNEEQN